MGAAREISGSRERFPIERSRAGVTPARLFLFSPPLRFRGGTFPGIGREIRRSYSPECLRAGLRRADTPVVRAVTGLRVRTGLLSAAGCVRHRVARMRALFVGMSVLYCRGKVLSRNVRPSPFRSVEGTGPAGCRNECRFRPVVIVLVPVCGCDKFCGGKGLRQARSCPVFAFLSV